MRTLHNHFSAKIEPSRGFSAVFLALFLLASGMEVWSGPKVLEIVADEDEVPALHAIVAVGTQGDVSSTIRLEGDLGLSVLGLAIDRDGAEIRGALRYGPFICGPGRLSGPVGFFSSPVSFAATSLGGVSVKVDSGFTSGLSLLSLDLGAATAFVLCRNAGKGFIARAPGLVSGEAATKVGAAGFSLAPQPIAGNSGCATGIVVRAKTAGGNLAFIAAASRSSPPEPGGSWRLDAPPDQGGLGLVAGLAYEARGQDWRSAFGFEYSWGPLRGGGSAARLEGSALIPPFRLSVSAGYAAAGFRDCLGEGEERGAALALGCSFPLWSGSSLRASCRMEIPPFDAAWRRGIALCDLIGRSASLSLSTRAGGGRSGNSAWRLGAGFSFGLSGDGSAFLAPDFGLSGRSGTAAWNLGLSGRWVEAPGETEARPSLQALLKAATPSSGPLSLVAGYCASWKQGHGPCLEADLGVSIAVFGDGRVSIDARWPKLELRILEAGEGAPAPVFRFCYSLAQ